MANMVKVLRLPPPIFDQRRKQLGGWWPRLEWILLLVPIVISCFQTSFAISIDNLAGQAGFRMASIRWSYPAHAKNPLTFRVKYCELHPWGLHRCRYQTVDESTARTGRQQETGQHIERDAEGADDKENFIVDIGGLRMSTNYSFQVMPTQDLGQKFGIRPSQISLQTKGFSAKATTCLADSSDVVVETGPFYGGRISVEDGSTTQGCFVKGNPQSPQTKYTLRIRHSLCGSTVVDGSKVTSVIVVQENIPILTHSTRRFVVVCSVSPDEFVVKAGVTLPRETSVAKSLDFNQIIKIGPQPNNGLHGEQRGRSTSGTGDSAINQGTLGIGTGRRIVEHHHFSDSSSLQQQLHHNSIPTNNLQQDAGQHYVSHLYAEKGSGPSAAESRALDEKLSRGTWETALVFGMICAAIVCSMGSVIWFIRSYRSINSAHEETIRRITSEDEDSNSSISYDGDSSSSSTSGNHSSLASSSEGVDVDVELDFEFSEDINRTTPTSSPATNEDVRLNISLQNFSYA